MIHCLVFRHTDSMTLLLRVQFLRLYCVPAHPIMTTILRACTSISTGMEKGNVVVLAVEEQLRLQP